MVTPSTPGAPRLARTSRHALQDVAAGDLVKERMETTIPILLGTAVEHALESTNPVHTQGAADGPSRYRHSSESFSSFACIDEARALPHVAGLLSRPPAVLRPAPTPARPPSHFPGSPVIGAHRFPPPRSGGAETGLPSSQDDHPHVQRPIRRRVPQRPLLDPRAPSMAFAAARTGSAPSIPRPQGRGA